MTTIDELWFHTTEANQQAEQAYHQLRDRHDDFIEFTTRKQVSKWRFRTLTERIRETAAPYGAHTIVYRPSGELLLVRHEGVDLWVLPGGEVATGETFLDAAKRELAEEAGVEATYDGLGFLTRIEIQADGYETWGIMPVFAARAETIAPDVTDPDDEISRARWFSELPEDTRDRDHLVTWREECLEPAESS